MGFPYLSLVSCMFDSNLFVLERGWHNFYTRLMGMVDVRLKETKMRS